ncbi:MAG: prepilin-type N-terminal cleavage/methylation domain-containing protein [Desulfobacteraceae bacterium]|nr:prepilin-type N-terminal cleavage/methylation domain-containing protein [Desulfobacteraceae bacterium]
MYDHKNMRNLPSDKKSGGFTLIEVLIAIVILSVGLLGMASLTVGIINGNRFSNDLTTATTLAQDKMEDIRRAGYTSAVSETKATHPSNSDYKREVTVTADSPATDMKTVSVKIYWGGASKEDHNVELKTILAK